MKLQSVRLDTSDKLFPIHKISLQDGDAQSNGALSERDLGLRQFLQLIERRRPRFVTLDVFDTTLWRPTREPSHLFDEVGLALEQAKFAKFAFLPGSFARLRAAAEKLARHNAVRAGRLAEVTLSDIYLNMSAVLI